MISSYTAIDQCEERNKEAKWQSVGRKEEKEE